MGFDWNFSGTKIGDLYFNTLVVPICFKKEVLIIVMMMVEIKKLEILSRFYETKMINVMYQ